MDADRITCCNQCKQPLIEIDNRGERLKGCLTCNLWSTVDRKLWKRLSEEDLWGERVMAGEYHHATCLRL